MKNGYRLIDNKRTIIEFCNYKIIRQAKIDIRLVCKYFDISEDDLIKSYYDDYYASYCADYASELELWEAYKN